MATTEQGLMGCGDRRNKETSQARPLENRRRIRLGNEANGGTFPFYDSKRDRTASRKMPEPMPTNPHPPPPHQAEGRQRPCPSRPGIAPRVPGRPGLPGEPERAQQQTPITGGSDQQLRTRYLIGFDAY